jgi:hypothetical protein
MLNLALGLHFILYIHSNAPIPALTRLYVMLNLALCTGGRGGIAAVWADAAVHHVLPAVRHRRIGGGERGGRRRGGVRGVQVLRIRGGHEFESEEWFGGAAGVDGRAG